MTCGFWWPWHCWVTKISCTPSPGIQLDDYIISHPVAWRYNHPSRILHCEKPWIMEYKLHANGKKQSTKTDIGPWRLEPRTMTRTRRTQGLERTKRIYTCRGIPYRKTAPGGPRGRGVSGKDKWKELKICGCYLKDPKKIYVSCVAIPQHTISIPYPGHKTWTWSFNGFEAVLYLRKAS